jgi:hypothetical protein
MCCLFLSFALATPALSAAAGLDTARIDQVTGAKGVMNAEEGVFKVSFPRDDVKVTVDGVRMPPFMGLTSWAAFKPAMQDGQAMVMGDVVLMQDEVNPAMDAAFEAGLSVTALHNHFFFDEPKVFFMHIGGEGPAEKLAAGVRAVLDRVKQVRSSQSQPGRGFGGEALPDKSTLAGTPLGQIMGTKPAEKDGMVKCTVGRSVKMPCGCEAGKEMGVNTWAAFYGSDDNAFVDGDFATFDGELQPVLHALRSAKINIVAIHQHMEGETPRVIFLHYWGRGQAKQLAQGVRSALDAQQARPAAAKEQK